MKGRKIKYYVRNVYGIDRFYINDPKEARNFQQLTKNETVSIEHMHALKELADVEFEEVIPQREVPV